MNNIYTAMNQVMQNVGYVQKAGKVGSGSYGYSYAGEVDFIRAVRPLLVEAGIVVHPAGIQQLNQDYFTTSKGNTMNRDTVIMVYHFHHGESDTGFDVSVLGQGSDSGDKSANKAMTAAYKYALRQALMIETGDDPDKELSEPQTSKPTDAQRRGFMAAGNKKYGDNWSAKRGELVEAVTKGRTRSSADLTAEEMAKLTKGMTS